ncbi:MAG: DNA-formamidopyrimidine glycosylase family protein [Thiotrichales bacterium]
MPEGDTIFQIATLLRPILVGRRIRAASMKTGDATDLIERAVVAVEARGKHLFIEFDAGVTLRTHLGLYGSWHRYAPGEVWRKPVRHAALVLATDRDVLVCFHAREVEWMATGGTARRVLHTRLGPDLAVDLIDSATVVARARELLPPEAPLVDVLLEQRVACGLGNVYKSEVLFLERQSPSRPLGDVPDPRLVALFQLGADLLRRNLGGGPRTTRFIDDGRGRLWVYRRRDRPCFDCGEPIRHARLGAGQRGTYWCARCQAG